MAQLENIIQKPLITEKSSLISEKQNRFGFIVDLKSSKNQIKEAVEEVKPIIEAVVDEVKSTTKKKVVKDA